MSSGAPRTTLSDRTMDHGRKPASPVQEGLVLGVFFFVVYALTRTRDVGGDDTVFAMAIRGFLDQGSLQSGLLLHPHHLLYNPVVAVVSRMLEAVGAHLLVLDVGALVSALAGATTAGLLVVVLRRHGASEGTTLLTAVVLGTSGGLWQFSTRLEVYAPAALAVLIWLAVVVSRRHSAGRLGGALSAAVLAHVATAVLSVPTAWRQRPRLSRLVPTLVIGLGLPSLLTLCATALSVGSFRPETIARRIVPITLGRHATGGGAHDVANALHGLLWWGWYRHTPVLQDAARAVFDGLAVAATILAAGLVALGVWRMIRTGGSLERYAAFGILAFSPLWLVWDVGNVEHTVAAAPLFAVLLAAGAESLPRAPGTLVLGALAACLVLGNGLGSAVPQSRPENGRVWVISDFVRRTTPPEATVLSLGRDARLRLGLQHLSGRRIVDLTLAAHSAERRARSPRLALRYWADRARAADQLWALSDVLAADADHTVGALGIPPETWHAVRAHLRPARREVLRPDGVVIREPFTLTRIRWIQTDQSNAPARRQ